MKLVAEQGLHNLGQHGGYINPEQWHGLKFDEAAPTDADGVSFPGSELDVAYWWYNKEQNKGNKIVFASLKPSVAAMENDLKRFVEEEVSGCLNKYSGFAAQGFLVSESGGAEATVDIVPRAVRFALEKPLAVKKGNTETSMKYYFVEIPVNLLHMYEIAEQIAKAQQDFSFLEKNTLGLITLFSGRTREKLMPMTDATFNLASTVTWSKKELKEKVKTILASYVPLLRYLNSKNFFEYRYPAGGKYADVKQRIYQDMVLPLQGGQDLEVRFNYLNFWDTYFEMNCEGDTCRPQSYSTSLFGHPFGIQRYKAVYDISYPVMVALNDPSAMNNQGYTFNFALEANVRNNRAVEGGQVLLPIESGFKRSLLCDEEHRNSGDVEVIVRDAYSHQGIENAQIAFVFGGEQCAIGVTGDNGVFVGKFPVAIGGYVHALAGNYVGSVRELDTKLDETSKVEIELMPYKDVELSVMKKKVLRCTKDVCYVEGNAEEGPLRYSPAQRGWVLSDNVFSDEAFPLKGHEQAVVLLTRVSGLDDPFTFAASVKGEESARINIPAGTYELSIQLLLDEELVIPADRRCSDTDGDGIDDECITIPEVRMPQFVGVGGLWS